MTNIIIIEIELFAIRGEVPPKGMHYKIRINQDYYVVQDSKRWLIKEYKRLGKTFDSIRISKRIYYKILMQSDGVISVNALDNK